MGHGQAVHAFTPAGETVVIDLGCSDNFSPLHWLRQRTDTIDLLIVTHPHGDHIDEFLLLGQLKFHIRQFWRPNWLPEREIYDQNQGQFAEKVKAYLEMSSRYNAPIHSSARVGNPIVSGGMSIQTFAARTCATSNINNHSGVVVFNYYGYTIVIPGDNEPPSWRALMQQPDFLNTVRGADVFMASHHGRLSGYCPELFSSGGALKLEPRLCIVSDGRVTDTDARDRYSYHASGMNVIRRNSSSFEKRSCVTTRCDGYIDLTISSRGLPRSLSVAID